jgi:hypothetical protein
LSTDNNYRYTSPYKREASVQYIKYGYDRALLDVELNEMQIIQDEARKSITRKLLPSGFLELVSKEFSGKPIIYNPNSDLTDMLNYIAIAPCRAIVNGMEVDIRGNFSADGYDGYTLINLGKPPKTGSREDLIYLEVWLENLTPADEVTKNGYLNGDKADYTMVDSRINEETSRRCCLRYDIKVATNIDFSTFPNGFGYINTNNFTSIQASVDGKLGYDYNANLVFRPADNAVFKDCEFYKDYNLYVGGRPDYTLKNNSIVGKYVFAIPMFRLKRRNTTAYSLSNFNGSHSAEYTAKDTSSATYGDLVGQVRPDKLSYDFFNEEDLVDLRHSVSIAEFSPEYYLNKGLKDILQGKAQTKDTRQMRRVQFGREDVDYTQNSNACFYVSYNKKSYEPTKMPDYKMPDYICEGAPFTYKDSVSSYGIYLNGKSLIKYLFNDLSANYGTIDFFIQPYWNGYDNTNQTILTIYDLNDNPVFILEKRKSSLIWTQYTNIDSGNSASVMNQIVSDLTTHLMFAKQIYHIRLSWTNDSKINRSLIYLNGTIIGEGTYTGSQLQPAKLVVGKIEELKNDYGCVIEELVAFKSSFDASANNSVYTYINNTYWPGIPEDFIANKSLIYPSFNSVSNTFADNDIIQDNTTMILNAEADSVTGETKGVFILTPPYQKTITAKPKCYLMSGNTDKDGKIIETKGTWTEDTATNIWTFTAEDTTLKQIFVVYSITVPGGNGGGDLPNEILAAGIIKDNKIDSEISFARKGTTELRKVEYANPAMVSAATDTAYDKSTTRDTRDCWARLLYYHKSGDGTNHYEIPSHLYGYEVIGVINATNRRIVKLERVPDEKGNDGRYVITLRNNVLYGDVLELKIALGGWTFDYETQTKTLVSNIHKTKMITVNCDGLRNEFIVPCFEPDGNGGVIKAAFNFTDNATNDDGLVTGHTEKYACYVDNLMFPLLQNRNAAGGLIDTYSNQLAEMKIDDSSWGTPFLKITLNWTPTEGTILTIPVLVSYLPKSSEIMSVWYNYIPYQGILDKNHKSLKRLSNWKYFMTTLGSGKISVKFDENNYYSMNNVINRLPGGQSYAYIIDGKNINFVNNSANNKTDVINKILFLDSATYATADNDLDSTFFELDSDFEVYRNTAGFQDEELQFTFNNFKAYLPDTTDAIAAYSGMACLVSDETGQLMVLLLSNLNNNDNIYKTSQEHFVTPLYGDLFKIQGLPCIKPEL